MKILISWVRAYRFRNHPALLTVTPNFRQNNRRIRWGALDFLELYDAERREASAFQPQPSVDLNFTHTQNSMNHCRKCMELINAWGQKSQPTLRPGEKRYFDRTVGQQFSRDRRPIIAVTIRPIVRIGTSAKPVYQRVCPLGFIPESSR